METEQNLTYTPYAGDKALNDAREEAIAVLRNMTKTTLGEQTAGQRLAAVLEILRHWEAVNGLLV